VLPSTFDAIKDPIDPYKTDRDFWRSLWHRPTTASATETGLMAK